MLVKPAIAASPLALTLSPLSRGEGMSPPPVRQALWERANSHSRHCERSEAIQSLITALDCFASLAMTAETLE